MTRKRMISSDQSRRFKEATKRMALGATKMSPVLGFTEFEALPHVVDPLQNEHLKEKLLESQLQHVEDLLRSWQQGAHSNMANSRAPDFCPRFYTTAQRDLHRAIRWYFTLKEKKSD